MAITIHRITPEREQKPSPAYTDLYRFLWFSDSLFKKLKKYHNNILNEEEEA
jgi:hypothetical protein